MRLIYYALDHFLILILPPEPKTDLDEFALEYFYNINANIPIDKTHAKIINAIEDATMHSPMKLLNDINVILQHCNTNASLSKSMETTTMPKLSYDE